MTMKRNTTLEARWVANAAAYGIVDQGPDPELRQHRHGQRQLGLPDDPPRAGDRAGGHARPLDPRSATRPRPRRPTRRRSSRRRSSPRPPTSCSPTRSWSPRPGATSARRADRRPWTSASPARGQGFGGGRDPVDRPPARSQTYSSPASSSPNELIASCGLGRRVAERGSALDRRSAPAIEHHPDPARAEVAEDIAAGQHRIGRPAVDEAAGDRAVVGAADGMARRPPAAAACRRRAAASTGL